MTEPMSNRTTQQDVLTQVHEGMDVYDLDGHKVGNVAEVFMGDVADAMSAGGVPQSGSEVNAPGEGSLVNDVARVFTDDLPDVVRNRLRHNGFVRVDGGLLGRNRYALREHVSGVDGKRVLLNVRSDELIKP